MTLKDGYGFGGFSLAPPSKQHLSTPPPPPPGPWRVPRQDRNCWLLNNLCSFSVQIESLSIVNMRCIYFVHSWTEMVHRGDKRRKTRVFLLPPGRHIASRPTLRVSRYEELRVCELGGSQGTGRREGGAAGDQMTTKRLMCVPTDPTNEGLWHLVTSYDVWWCHMTSSDVTGDLWWSMY